jgi:hypothetical protein
VLGDNGTEGPAADDDQVEIAGFDLRAAIGP